MTDGAPESTRGEAVRQHFLQPDPYLSGRFNIALRAEIIAEFVGERSGLSVLDIGCGDGSLSRQFLEAGSHVTHLDLSSEMLRRAKMNVSSDASERAQFVEGSFLDRSLTEQLSRKRFDLVLCVGVLAHVGDLETAAARLAELTEAGGRVIVQFSDYQQPSYWPTLAYQFLRNRVRNPYGYELRPTPARRVNNALSAQGLRVQAERRYWTPLPVVRRFVPDARLDAFQRFTLEHTLLSRFGSEVMWLMTR